MYTINNKFEIGEECYAACREQIECECPVCKGSKKIIYNGYEIPCKQCDQTGKIRTNQSVLVPCKVKVTRVSAVIWKEHMAVKYKVVCIDDVLRSVNNRQENGLFKTLEEAEEYCRNVNSGQTVAAF